MDLSSMQRKHNKSGLYRGGGPLYTMTGSSGHITVLSTPAMPFFSPIRSKATITSASTPLSATQAFAKMHSNPLPSKSLSSIVTATMSTAPSKIEYTYQEVASTHTKTDGSPIVNAIKGFFNTLLRPIVSKATTTQFIPITTEHNGTYETSNAKFHETSTNMYMNVMPVDMEASTFFDCDDYVDNEDTVDFIAGTTPKFDEFNYEQIIGVNETAEYSPKQSAYFDCVSNISDMEQSTEKMCATDDVVEDDVVIVEPIAEKISTEKMHLMKKALPDAAAQQTNVNCGSKVINENVDKTMGHCRRRNGNRRRRDRRRTNKSDQRSVQSLAANKNRNTKHRHELEQLILDDMECIHEHVADNGQDDDYLDAETRVTVDSDCVVDAQPRASVSNASTAPASPVTAIEPFFTEGTSGMFSCLISFDPPDAVYRPRPPLRKKPRGLHRWTSSDRPLHYRLSESDSEDNYIVYDGINSTSVRTDDLIGNGRSTDDLHRSYIRQRQMSECSDDFICFEYDDNDFGNCIHGVNETTDEEFTSDSDDSDDETSDSDSDECDFGEPKRFSIENNPPDSGFEERKVRFNLSRPQVHEIRAWKYAYREARKGQWEQVGRDRERFEKKIKDLSQTITPILATAHRQRIFDERFSSTASVQPEINE